MMTGHYTRAALIGINSRLNVNIRCLIYKTVRVTNLQNQARKNDVALKQYMSRALVSKAHGSCSTETITMLFNNIYVLFFY